MVRVSASARAVVCDYPIEKLVNHDAVRAADVERVYDLVNDERAIDIRVTG